EAHFVWLRSDYFNYMGQVWWQTYVAVPGLIDLLFLDLENFYAFRDGRPYQTIVPPLGPATDGAQYASDLSGDLPYFLIIRNAGSVTVHDMGFHPEVIRVPVGSTVEWTNHDGTNHSVNLGILPGGFVVIPAGGAPLSAVLGLGALAAAPAVGLLLFLRRRARAAEGS